jgi:hypothetical protein
LPSRLLSENVKIKKMYEAISLPAVLYGREIWSLTFRDRVLRITFIHKSDRKQEIVAQ